MKSDKLSSFALAIAAVILLIVGMISYRDYLKAKYEKEFGVAASQAQQTAGAQANALVPPSPQQIPADPATPAQALPPMENAGAYTPPPPVPGNPQANAGATAPPPLSPIQSAAQARLSQYQEDLKTLQQENEIYRAKLETTRNGTLASGPIPSFPPTPESNLPNSAVSAVPAMPADDPALGAPSPLQQQQTLSPKAIAEEFSALSEKIRKEASIAKVVDFDPEWAFLVLSGGRDRGIELDMRFAVRRGTEILGWVKITEVEENRSVAQLMSGNKDSQTARKPEPGDDLIAFNLF